MRWIALLLLTACTSAKAPCYQDVNRYPLISGYKVEETGRSELGYVLDDPKNELNVAVLDYTLTKTVECVRRLLPLTTEEFVAAGCVHLRDQGSFTIKSCLVIKAAPEWHVSSCTGNQIFACNAPAASCLAKGQTPTAECPCSCRAAVQDDTVIVTTPNLELVPWRFVELITGCQQIQNVPRLAACGDPVL